jgi:hypothetical protein
MTRATKKVRSVRVTPSAAHIYIPHSSWSRVDSKPAPAAPIAAEDFWARLGL